VEDIITSVAHLHMFPSWIQESQIPIKKDYDSGQRLNYGNIVIKTTY